MKQISDLLERLKSRPSHIEQEELLLSLEEQIKKIFRSIKSIEDSNREFKCLDEIQFVLARLVFNEGLIVSPGLRKFIVDFERVDDMEWRKTLLSKIKNSEYYFSTNK